MKLLFVCTHNACRSVLAEVIARKLSGDRIETASAGSHPSGNIHPLTLQYLQTNGYSSAGLSSKGFDAVQDFAPDVVITVCDRAANESCPVWLGHAVKAHWGLPDPSQIDGTGQDSMAAFDAVVTTIAGRIEALLAQPFESFDDNDLEAALQAIAKQY